MTGQPGGPTFVEPWDTMLVAEPCPDCGGKVRYGLTCHTWGGNADGTGWRACLPCDSAYDLYCEDDDCGWSYTWGLNPRNPRSVDNERRRPPWIAEGSMPDLL